MLLPPPACSAPAAADRLPASPPSVLARPTEAPPGDLGSSPLPLAAPQQAGTPSAHADPGPTPPAGAPGQAPDFGAAPGHAQAASPSSARAGVPEEAPAAGQGYKATPPPVPALPASDAAVSRYPADSAPQDGPETASGHVPARPQHPTGSAPQDGPETGPGHVPARPQHPRDSAPHEGPETGPGHVPARPQYPAGSAPHDGPEPYPTGSAPQSGPVPARGHGVPAPQYPSAWSAAEQPAGAGREGEPAEAQAQAAIVPRQKDGTARPRVGGVGPVGPEPAALPDLLDHPDPAIAAEAAAVENLLRCWVRETGLGGPVGTLLRIPLPASGSALLVAVRHWSLAGWHRFSPPRLEGAPVNAPALDAVTLAALIAREGNAGGRGGADLVGRVADSLHRTAEFIADRRERPAAPAPVAADLFLTSEQSLLLGHPLQPDPKSRQGLSEAEVRRYSPELHGSFPLHWLAVAPAALATDSAWTERGRPVSAAQLLARLAPGLPLPEGTTPLPLHPWQARDLLQRPAVAALRDAGLLTDLGPYGEPWYPTSSVRTVHRPGAPAMVKLSLGLRITNSRRENLRKELHRGVEVHRLLRTGLAEHWQAAHPGFDIVRDPAWVAVDAPDGTPVPGLDALLRHNPFRSDDDAVCIAALTTPRPWPGRTTMRSRLAETVTRLAAATGRPLSAVAAEWFLRYLDHVVLPVLAFDALAGIALEAHQQNTLVLLDRAGWPVGGRYRDNQGYYFRDSHRAELEHRLPGIGSASDTFVSDSVTDERFAYYLGINNVLGLIGAFGSQRLADERVLLAAFRRFLGKASNLGPLPARLLDSPTLRCKANLLTRLGGLDELVGPVDTQSVYVTIANPLHD
ncbi:iron transporter [Streptomyces sp. ISL-86]|nr:iron transporter [Streptomyces sp. ISL-86]